MRTWLCHLRRQLTALLFVMLVIALVVNKLVQSRASPTSTPQTGSKVCCCRARAGAQCSLLPTSSVRVRQRHISLYAIIAFFFVLFLSFPFDRTVIRVNALQVQHRSIATLWLRLRKNKENNNNSKMQSKMPLHIAYFICSFAVVYIYAGTLVCFDVACIKNATPAMPTHTLLRIPKTLPRKTSDHPYKICHICIWFVCLSIQTL